MVLSSLEMISIALKVQDLNILIIYTSIKVAKEYYIRLVQERRQLVRVN